MKRSEIVEVSGGLEKGCFFVGGEDFILFRMIGMIFFRGVEFRMKLVSDL